MASSTSKAIAYHPHVVENSSRVVLEDFALLLSSLAQEDGVRQHLEAALAGAGAWPRADRQGIEGGLRVLADQHQQGWGIELTDKGIFLIPPTSGGRGGGEEKLRVRRQELLKRDEQLSEPATRKFVSSMERRRIHGDSFSSIFTLFRDGRELAERLEVARGLEGEDRLTALGGVIDPYLVFFGSEDACPHTGLRLMDVWRYFRHTWANQYTSVPGRSMPFLVRDRAAPGHPILGIGALGSSIMQIKQRDIELGWHPETLLERLKSEPTPAVGAWLWGLVSKGLEELYLEDFLEEGGEGGLLTPGQLKKPGLDVIQRIRAHAQRCREEHQKNPDAGTFRPTGKGSQVVDWQKRARTNLFASKRALALADLLEARLILGEFLSQSPTADEVTRLAADRRGARVVKRLIKRAKSARVGTAMADIIVCGALPPYGPLLGGKLVCLLAASPGVVQAYRERYSGAESEITSAMAGRPICRPAELVFLGTTSLYGRSSQYNRVRMPAELIGGEPSREVRFVRYKDALDPERKGTSGYGTSQFSEGTLKAFDALLRQSDGGKRVNNIFGEGTSPKLRKVRDALIALGFQEGLLQHHRQRDLYGVPLISNLKAYLLGMEDQPRYLFDSAYPSADERIGAWWRERWLARRIESDEVLAAVRAHTLTWPIAHGARVPLPPEDEDQPGLFDDI